MTDKLAFHLYLRSVNFIDDTGYQLSLNQFPKRIISLVPSQTELLFDLGLDKEVVGITKFCIHPKERWSKLPRVGGTKNVDFNQIRALDPDLIICNKEENTEKLVQALREEFPVFTTNVCSVEDAFSMIRNLGMLIGKAKAAEALASNIEDLWMNIRRVEGQKRVIYIIWNDPVMVAANDTFIHSVLEWCGYSNAAAHLTRYPVLSIDQILEINPDLVFLSSEPYPFKEKQLSEWEDCVHNTQVRLVDGEPFSWYGSRMIHAPDYFAALRAELE